MSQPAGVSPRLRREHRGQSGEKGSRRGVERGLFEDRVVVVAHYSGLTVAQMQNLRKQAREAGASVQVAKNRLAKIALDGTTSPRSAPCSRDRP